MSFGLSQISFGATCEIVHVSNPNSPYYGRMVLLKNNIPYVSAHPAGLQTLLTYKIKLEDEGICDQEVPHVGIRPAPRETQTSRQALESYTPNSPSTGTDPRTQGAQ